MSSTTGTPRKTSTTTAGRRVPSATRDQNRKTRRGSQSLRVSTASTQQSSNTQIQIEMPEKVQLTAAFAPPRPADPMLFLRAGTTGVRHLYPVHFSQTENPSSTLFSRPISRLRSRTPTTEICSNVEMIRNVCAKVQTLQHFDVSYNELESLPLDVSLLVELETLNCSHNALTELNSLLEQLKHLKELDISFNRFVEFPSVIFTMKSLTRLNCEHNHLKTIPMNLINLKRLKFFIGDHNQLETIENVDFSQMKKLEYIHCAHNQLMKFPRGLQQLHYLRNVNLSHNRLKTFPIDILLLNTLDVLNLSDNLISKLPPLPIAYKRATLIFSIDLSSNQLSKFYEYLLFIALKVDVSNNKIRTISSDFIKRLSNEVMSTRELKIHNNPLTQPSVPVELLQETSSVPLNALRTIRTCYEEQQSDSFVRQGVKISIVGPKNSGKTALANCLEELAPLTTDETEEKNEKFAQEMFFEEAELMINYRWIQQFSFRLTVPPAEPPTSTNLIGRPSVVNFTRNEMPRLSTQLAELLPNRKRRAASISASRLSISAVQRASVSTVTTTGVVPIVSDGSRTIPLTIYDFNGSPEYFPFNSMLIDTYALHLVCVPAFEFFNDLPLNLEEIFDQQSKNSPPTFIEQLIEILEILCDKASKTRAIMIFPIATFLDIETTKSQEEEEEKFVEKKVPIDKSEKRTNRFPAIDRNSESTSSIAATIKATLPVFLDHRIEKSLTRTDFAIERIDEFFRLFREHRRKRIEKEIDKIRSLPMISSSLSDRLKTFTTLLDVHVQIDGTHGVSSLKYLGIEELIRKIQRCIVSERKIFPHVERILPTLWAETNSFIESLADVLPLPYILWQNFSELVVSKHGLAHLLDDITLSLHEEGKIIVLNEIGTTDRAVFLRPSWLLDLVHNLFRLDMKSHYLDYERNELFSLNNMNETRFQNYKKEFLHYGLLHCDLLRIFWLNLVGKKEPFYHICLSLMRFLLIGYPKMNKGQLKRLIQVHTPDLSLKGEKRVTTIKDVKYDQTDLQFDYVIIPYYLPTIGVNDQQEEIKRFHQKAKNFISARFSSNVLPVGIFHRFSVSAVLRLNLIYKKHWNNFILGEHEEKDVQFFIETDHRNSIVCSCGTSLGQQTFEEIWNVLMPILNHFEEIFLKLSPSNQFDRAVRCPFCQEFSFQGEWMTPKELQCSKLRACPNCSENVDTFRLVQPNENKRRSEELLKRIRERHAKSAKNPTEDLSSSGQILVSAV